MANRYYNIIHEQGSGSGHNNLTIAECNSSGTYTPDTEMFGKASYRNASVRYVPAQTPFESYVVITSHDGDKSPKLTVENVILLTGTAHGAANNKALYELIYGQIKK